MILLFILQEGICLSSLSAHSQCTERDGLWIGKTSGILETINLSNISDKMVVITLKRIVLTGIFTCKFEMKLRRFALILF